MAKRKQTTLAQAIKELDGKTKEYFILTIGEDKESCTIISQGNPIRMAQAVEKGLEDLKQTIVQDFLTKLLED